MRSRGSITAHSVLLLRTNQVLGAQKVHVSCTVDEALPRTNNFITTH